MGAIAVVILDGAGRHTSPRLRRPDNIVLPPSPACSPDLDPAENIREFLRSDLLSRAIWLTYDAVLDAYQDIWNELMRMPECIASMTGRSRAKPVAKCGALYF